MTYGSARRKNMKSNRLLTRFKLETLEDRIVPTVPGDDSNPQMRYDAANGYWYEVPVPTKPTVSLITRPSDHVDKGETPTSGTVNQLAPPLTANFDGLDYNTQATASGFFNIPPDTQGAAGPSHLVTAVNTAIRWSSKTNTSVVSKKLGNNGTITGAFFDLSGTANDPTTSLFDPRVLFDQYANRFVVIAAEQTDTFFGDPANTSFIFVAVSNTSDPNGTWNLQRFNSKITIGADSWCDYPALAVDGQAIYITGNYFTFGGAPSFTGQRLFILNKGIGTGGLYDSGGSSTVTTFDPAGLTGQSATTTMPAHTFGTVPGTAGTWLVRYSGFSSGGIEQLSVIRVNNPLSSPTFSHQFLAVTDIDNTGASLPLAPQSGTATTLNTGDRRALQAVWRNNNLYLVANIRPGSGVDAAQCTAHWWRVDTGSSPTFTLTLADQGNIGGEDIATGAHTYYPAIAVNSNGDIGFGFSASASTIFPGAYYTGRAVADAAGTVQSSGTLQAGLAFYIRTFGGGSNRWGDYSGAAVDPSNDSFWVIQEYAKSQGDTSGGESGRWSTRWGNFAFGDTTGPTISSVGTVTSPRNSAVASVTVTFSELINLTTFTAADISLTRNGSGVSFSGNETFTQVGATTTYTIGNLTEETGVAGNYVLTIVPTGIQDPSGNNGTGSNGVINWTTDTTAPTIVSVGPVTSPRTTSVASVNVVFSELINLSTFTVADIGLTLGGSPVAFSGNETFTQVGATTTYTIGNLTEETGVDGNYVLSVTPTGIQDLAGNNGTGAASTVNWTKDSVRPTIVSLGPVVPNPRNTAVSTVSITFSEVINAATFDSLDLDLALNGGGITMSGNETLTQVGATTTYTIGGLAEETAAAGNYVLTFIASGIADPAGNPGLGTANTSWTVDLVGPAILSIETIVPNPRATPVSTIDVTFDQPINLATFTVADLSLTLNAAPVTFSGNETFTFVSGNTYQVGNLTEETTAPGNYVFTVSAAAIADPAGNNGTGSGNTTWTTTGGDTTAPTVTGMFIDGTAWTTAFRTAAGNATFGYPAQTGAGQLTTLPWSTINTFYVTFSESVGTVTVSQVGVRGINVATYTVSSVAMLGGNTIAKITLSSPIDTDWLIVDLDGSSGSAIQDGAGNKLAGAFTESVSTFPTTGAAGVNFKYRFKVAVGDADRNAIVRNADVNLIRSNLFVDAGAGGYNLFADIDGNGLVRNADVNSARAHLFVDAPTGPGPSRPRGGAVGGGLTGGTRLGRFASNLSGSIGRADSTATARRPAGSFAASVIDELFAEV